MRLPKSRRIITDAAVVRLGEMWMRGEAKANIAIAIRDEFDITLLPSQIEGQARKNGFMRPTRLSCGKTISIRSSKFDSYPGSHDKFVELWTTSRLTRIEITHVLARDFEMQVTAEVLSSRAKTYELRRPYDTRGSGLDTSLTQAANARRMLESIDLPAQIPDWNEKAARKGERHVYPGGFRIGEREV